MASVNKVHLLGNCGRDPEIRYLPSGMAICNVSVATSSKRKDKNSGETIEETQWHRVQFFDKLAEIAGQYLKKGNPVYIEGRIKYGKFTDKDGVEKTTCDIIAESMQLLGGRDGGQQQEAPRQAALRQAQAPRSAEPQRQAPPQSGGFADMQDDVPW